MKLKKIIASILAFCMVLSTMSVPVAAEEAIVVAKIGETPFETLAAAIDVASPGDEIDLCANVEKIPTITKAITIDGNGYHVTAKADEHQFAVIDGTVTLKNLVYDNGTEAIRTDYGNYGGATEDYVNLNLVIEGCVFNGVANYAIMGGQSTNKKLGALTVTNCTFNAGTVCDNYMVYAQQVGALTITGCTFNGNGVTKGAIHTGDSLNTATVATISDCSISGVERGIQICNRVDGGSVNISGVEFENITAAEGEKNGAIYVYDYATTSVSATDNTFTNCTNVVSTNNTTEGFVSTIITTFTGNTVEGKEVVLNADGTVTEGTGSEETTTAVAQIGDTGYETLAKAFAAASAMTGDVTVEIYDKVTLNQNLSGSYDSITFVGKDTDAEIYLDVQGYITATGKAVAFEDLKLSKAEGGFITNAGFMNVAFGVYDVTKVTYTDCTFANGAYASSGDVTFTECTFYRSHDKYGLWAYGDADITVDSCTFDDYRGIKMYAEGAAKTTNLTVKNSDFSALDSKPAIVLTYGESVTLEGNTYSSTGVFELDLDGAPNGTPVTTDTNTITCKNDNGACGVLVDGKIYTTVAQAAAVATEGSTITLLHDSAETVELAEGVILDKNGYTADGVTVAAPALVTVNAYVAQDTHVNGWTTVWGQLPITGTESFYVEIYSGETYLGKTTLVDTEKVLLDGTSHEVTWHAFLDGSDSWWNTEWTVEPVSNLAPTDVKYYVDGNLIGSGVVKMSSADDLNPVVWEELRGVTTPKTGLSGTGTKEDPYQITSIDELKWFRDDVNAGNTYDGMYIKLTTDINLNNEEWTPIGTSSNYFKGMFDGDNHTISNLYINWSTEYVSGGNNQNYVGLFGRMNGAGNDSGIKNLTIENADVSGCLYVGAVLGRGYTSGIIENCHVTGNVDIEGYSYIGGIVGRYEYSTGTTTDGTAGVSIYNCSVKDTTTEKGTINGLYEGATYIGGILGFTSEPNPVMCFEKLSVENISVTGYSRVGGTSGIAHQGNIYKACSVSEASIYGTDSMVGLLVGACQGTQSSPVTFTDNTVDAETKAYSNETEVSNLYGTNISGEAPVTNCVAQVGRTMYETLADALAAAEEAAEEAEQTVAMLADTESFAVVIPAGVTLDLNGYSLKGTYVSAFGNIVDSSEDNAGVLKVDSKCFMIRQDNEQLPVKVEGGYRFFEVTEIKQALLENNTKYAFQPFFDEGLHELLLGGQDTTGVTVNVRLSWTQGEGVRSQNFAYIDDIVENVVGSYDATTGKYDQMFTLTVTGTEGLKDLVFEAVVKSDTGVEIKSGVTKVEIETESGNVTTNDQNEVVNEVQIDNTQASAVVAAGTKLVENTTQLTLTAEEMDATTSNITVGEGEQMLSLNVHVEGVAKDNTIPVIITLNEVAPDSLNQGNISLYHVEDGETVAMTRVYDLAELDAHNEFYYDITTGTITMAMATFSEIVTLTNIENAWNGKIDTSWYNTTDTEFKIYNADQLVGFGQIVGGMAKDSEGNTITRDSFAGKTVKLVSDINLGDSEAANNKDIIFYPIGYYNNQNTYDREGVAGIAGVESGVYSFEGTFDGNGHTISNFYQNTWEMLGDYNNGYDGTPNYYKDAMGLFGYVVNGVVRNLTVDNFSSDGEFTPTGAIAAYAVDSTFENIAITNCNPRVYNTGNGGIVGIGGNSDDAETAKLTFTNITIDNTNKISALWGSWDVACGGLVGMFRGAGHVDMTNCHVAAQIDVYNDVCGNYQYYWYRYAGMMVGTNKNMVTDDNGNTVPETNKFQAVNCTVHFGEWNNYYYCELVANSLASYTHDHQFSRLEEVDAVDVANKTVTVGEETIAIPTNGKYNYVVVQGEPAATENALCYHFVDGEQWNHSDAGTETVNDEVVLKEDKQHIYLPFNQLFTGYGWGVEHIPVYNGEDYAFEGITILDREVADSVVKFDEVARDSYTTGETVTIGDLFKAATIADENLTIKPENVQVTVSPADENSTVVGTYTADAGDWTQGELTFEGTGAATITITDYYFCTPTTITVTIEEPQSVDKFDLVFENTDAYLYRVGNANTVALGSLFKTKDGAEIGNVSVTVEALNGADVSGIYTSASDWTKGTIQFSGTGPVLVTIDDDAYANEKTLYLEVVDATNTTTAASATANNVVLLNDCNFSSLTVSSGYTLYGNGFTMTCGSDSSSTSFGEFVSLESGTLDNVQIVCPNYDYAALYNSQLKDEDANRIDTTTSTTRYYNAKSAVSASGNSQILNSRISGGRAALYASSGNIVIDNSRIELGVVANILVSGANSLVLRDATLVQKPTASTYDSTKTLMGLSVLYLCDADGNATPTTLEGGFVQYAWADESCSAYLPEGTESIMTEVLSKQDYVHVVNEKNCVNLGFAYMPNSGTTVNEPSNITDNRTEKDSIPYQNEAVSAKVSTSVAQVTVSTYVYTYCNSNGNAFSTVADYIPNKYSDIISISYSDTAEGLSFSKSYGTNGWIYEMNVDLDTANGYALDFSKLSMSVNGVTVTDFKVNGADKPTTPVTVVAGGTSYTLTATVNGTEYSAAYKVTGTETSKEAPTVVNSDYANCLLVGEKSTSTTWSAAAPALEGIKIRYYSVAEKDYKEIDLSSLTPTATGKQNGTNAYWDYSESNGDYSLTITNTAAVHDGKSIFAMPVVCDNKLYFVITSSDGLVSTSSGSRNVKLTYVFEDNNGGKLEFTNIFSASYDSSVTLYDYSDFCTGTLNEASGGCVTPDTLVTLADGTEMSVDALKGNEELLVWNHETGKLDNAPVAYIVDHDGVVSEHEIIHLNFANGKIVKIIGEHVFFDSTLNKYVAIDTKNVDNFVGHTFAALSEDSAMVEKVELISVERTVEETVTYEVVSYKHLTCFTEGVLSTSAYLDPLLNVFDVDADTMAYTPEVVQKDIETYGLYTYDDFEGIISEEAFELYNAQYLKIAVGKGYITWDDILDLIDIYFNSNVQPI